VRQVRLDQEAVAKARELTAPYPPSSPSIALFKDGELVHFVERHHIEGRTAEMIGNHLVQVFEEYC
jgi:putative YphP/YqiW family bacilliredoxin